ncbi:serine hydrolase domain-containing protein [Streptomyces pactum]|uniref:serine hydrolase domain-containing protein n=1 Tax=Streptomyces pactum TaxID=68249 RepID=UPI0036FD4FC8
MGPRSRAPLAAVLVVVLVAAVAGCGDGPRRKAPAVRGGPAAAPAAPPDLGPGLRRLVERGPAPGGAVLVVSGGRGRFAAAGVSDLATGRPVGRADHFRAGSLTKTFLATVVLQLVAEGRLGLDDPVEEHLPGLLRGPGHGGRTVTIRQLLDHTSGLYDYTRDPALARRLFGAGFAAHRFDSHTPRGLVRIALAHPPVFGPPGGGWAYSNTDYTVLGLVVERVTGRGYAAEARRRIIEPLGLTGTSFPGTRPTLPRPHGRGYAAGAAGGAPRDVTEFDPSSAGAAGELVSTLDDLARFHRALLGGELLPPSGLARMRDTGPSRGRYGMGLFPVTLPCGRVWGHNGTINGSSVLLVGSASGDRVLVHRLNHTAAPDRAAERALLRRAFCGGG